MSAVSLELGNVRAELPPAAESAARRLRTVEDVMNESLAEARRMIWDLRGQSAGPGDLGVALSRLIARLAEGRAVACRADVEGPPVPLGHEIEGSLFRIAQEAVTNALKHAGARRIDVRLEYREHDVRLSVADDGHGFDPERAAGADDGHFGLTGMRERAGRLGAVLTIASRPGHGTTVEVVTPESAVRRARD